MLVLSLAVSEIFAKQEKSQNFHLENEGQGQEVGRNLRHSAGNVQIHIFLFII